MVPSWKKEIKSFRVPTFLNEAHLEVIEKKAKNDIVLGELRINLTPLILNHNQIMHNQEIYLHDKLIGTINFDTVKGKNSFETTSREVYSPRKTIKNSKNTLPYEAQTLRQVPQLASGVEIIENRVNRCLVRSLKSC